MSNFTIADLKTLMARLREPVYGCPWDQAQSYQTIAPSTLEEAYEVVDAIEQGSAQQLKEELGDLLFQVIFYSQLGVEEGEFDFDGIVSDLVAKLIRRHPHVFPDGTLASRINPATLGSEDREAMIKASWETIKKEEREQKGQMGLLDDVPAAFPALPRAAKLQKRTSRIGFDWPNTAGVYDKLNEEIAELKAAEQNKDADNIEEELGDLLFTVVNLSRHLKVDPESALRRANQKFEARFKVIEQIAAANKTALDGHKKIPADELEKWWSEAKKSV